MASCSRHGLLLMFDELRGEWRLPDSRSYVLFDTVNSGVKWPPDSVYAVQVVNHAVCVACGIHVDCVPWGVSRCAWFCRSRQIKAMLALPGRLRLLCYYYSVRVINMPGYTVVVAIALSVLRSDYVYYVSFCSYNMRATDVLIIFVPLFFCIFSGLTLSFFPFRSPPYFTLTHILPSLPRPLSISNYFPSLHQVPPYFPLPF